MVKRLVLYILTITLLIGADLAKAQDPHFSQFYANPLYLNPAFAGSAVCPRLIMNYRNQWPAISGAYVTYNAGFDMRFDALHGGLGILATADKAGEGVLSTNNISLLYSYHMTPTRSFNINVGFQGTYFQKSIDVTKLTFGSQIDPRWGFVKEPPTLPNMSASGVDFQTGIIGYSEKFYIGFASHHLVEPDEGLVSYSMLPRKYTFHTGGIIPLTKNGKKRLRDEDPVLSPNLVFQQQGEFHQLNYGLYVNKMPMIAGLWYRHFFEGSDAVIVLVGFQYDKFKFGYSYDITVSKLASASGGSHEFSFALMFNCPQRKKRIREINCPSF
ncbi:MAG: type IX secretion system membrane protein PorP/SprF [Saprospiraceae bacterium]|nr:type IX secretion system membrane protein PorP/SprF [Saprospiraceae bacterium]